MGMKFAMFYEIPVPEAVGRPTASTRRTRTRSSRRSSATGWASTRSGRSSTTSSTSTRTARTPRCSTAPSRRVTENMRLGYGVRLLPKPYNHPIRTAESVAVLDLVCDGRVEFGTGRSSTRAEIEGFGIDPHETREMWNEALTTSSALDQRRVRVRRQALADARRAACTRSRCRSRTRRSGARRRASTATTRSAATGSGCCSFTVGIPPEELEERIANYRRGPGRLHAAGRQVRQRAARRRSRWCTARHQREGRTRSPTSRSSGTRSTARWLIASLAEHGWRARTSATTATRASR